MDGYLIQDEIARTCSRAICNVGSVVLRMFFFWQDKVKLGSDKMLQ